jgi:predicted aconitase
VTVLTPADRAMLAGDAGPGVARAMRILLVLAEAVGAERFIDITGAHIDGCLYHGPAGLDFARSLANSGAEVRVPTTLNVASLDLLHPDLYRGDASTAAAARDLMDAYVAMGCTPTWTCAPYQLETRPGLGEQIAWGESNAIAFANSVLGARTERYGDFTDICAALTGRVPAAGYHLDAGRRAGVVIDVTGVGKRLRSRDVFFAALGHVVGAKAGSRVPAIVGVEAADEDQLKALGAAAASSGAVGLFHVVGVTPEAPTLRAVTDGQVPTIAVDGAALRAARDELSTATAGRLASVNLGTPHASAQELARLASLFAGAEVAAGVACYVSTGREVLTAVGDAVAVLEGAGVRLVTDTCTYITPIIEDVDGIAMTDSAKWAYYAPANIGVDTIFASTEECVASALSGRVTLDLGLWDA